MKRAIHLLAPVVLAFAAAHAAHADVALVTEARPVSDFHAIDIPGTLAVDVTIGSPARVEVRGEADLVGKIVTGVKDGTLVLDTKLRNFRGKNHLSVAVTVPSLDALSIPGIARVKVTGLAADTLALRVPGTGQITLDGSARRLDITIDGTGNLEAERLAAKDATVDVSGTGSASLRATQSVAINVSGTGSVEVTGSPAKVKKHVTGVGSVSVH